MHLLNIEINRPLHTVILLILLAAVVIGNPILACAQENQAEIITAQCDSGYAFLNIEEYQKAQVIFSDVLRLEKNSPKALLGMGRAFLGLPNGGGRALDYLRRAVQQAPESLDAHYYKAYAHAQMARGGFLNRDDGRQALEEIEIVLSLNPSHAEAYYLRGQVYRDVFQDYANAIEAFRFQVEVNPGHISARVECLKAEIDVGVWTDAISTAEGMLSREPDIWEIMPLLAAAYWKASRADEAIQTFERFFAIAPENERGLYFNLGYLLTPAEQSVFMSLDDEGLQAYWMNYWRSKDPDPKTLVNERLLEHFIRIAYARIEFGKEKWPWDARGSIYVRYGEPNIRSGKGRIDSSEALLDAWDFFIKHRDLHIELGLLRPAYLPGFYSIRDETVTSKNPLRGIGLTGGATDEKWFYTDIGLFIQFDDPVMSGRYLIADVPFGADLNKCQEVSDAMERHIPVISEEEDKIETFDPLQSAVTFRGEDGKTEMEYAIGLLQDHIGQFQSITGEHATIEAQIDLFTLEWKPAGEATEQIQTFAARPQFNIRGNPVLVHNVTISADPSDYLVSILVMEPETGIRATLEEKMSFPDYSGDDLMISDIMPAARITEVSPGQTGRFIRGDLEVIPLPGRMLGKDQPLFIYFEIYNLAQDRFGRTRYRIEYSVSESTSDDGSLKRLFQGLGALVGISGRPAVLSSEFNREGIQIDVRSHLEIDMSALPHDVYDLIVTITDQVSGQIAASVLSFRTLPIVPY